MEATGDAVPEPPAWGFRPLEERPANRTSGQGPLVEGLWDAHVYGAAVAWLLLALYSAISAINMPSLTPHKSKVSRICVYISAGAVLRGLYFLVDPYERHGRLPLILARSVYISLQPLLMLSFLLGGLVLVRLCGAGPGWLRSAESLGLDLAAAVALALLILSTAFPVLLRGGLGPAIGAGMEAASLVLEALLCLTYLHLGAGMLEGLRTSGGNSKGRSYRLKLTNLSLPRIRITDENECSLSYKSEASSFVSESDAAVTSLGDPDKGPKRRKRKSRSRRLAGIIRGTLVSACLGLVCVGWALWERCGRSGLVPWDTHSKAWLVILSMYRLIELIWGASLAYNVRHGFNKLRS